MRQKAAMPKARLGEFLNTNLKLTLSMEKTFITHANDEKAKFLGHEITLTRQRNLIFDDKKRATNGYIALLMPRKVVHEYRSGYSKKGKIAHRAELIVDTDYKILQRYQSVLMGVYNYWCMAVNVSRRIGDIK